MKMFKNRTTNDTNKNWKIKTFEALDIDFNLEILIINLPFRAKASQPTF